MTGSVMKSPEILTVTREHDRLCDKVPGDDEFDRQLVVRDVLRRPRTDDNAGVRLCIYHSVLRLNSTQHA